MRIWIDKELFQWERERYIFLDFSEENFSIDHVQIYNDNSKIGTEVSVYNNKAKIPNKLLQECLPITVLACNGPLGSAKVMSRRSFKVLKRPKPESYYDDPEDLITKVVIFDGGEEG